MCARASSGCDGPHGQLVVEEFGPEVLLRGGAEQVSGVAAVECGVRLRVGVDRDASAAIGSHSSARSRSRSRWTMRQSRALQALTRRVLALQTTARPFVRSPSRSKAGWTMPAPVSITGMRAFSRTKRISPAPPRGITTST